MEKIEWEASEYTISKRSTTFYVAFVLAVLSMAGLAILIRSWTFLAVVIVAAIALIVQQKTKPPIVKYSVSRDAIKINDRELPISGYKSYSFTGPEGKPTAINFIPKKRFKEQAVLQLPKKDFDVKKLQKLLADKIPEIDNPSGLLDIISQKIRG
ncbi:hypothetical protein FWG86_01405 [Candidatus Saccharibacteria bacterium]|nr:hypothetical protein [Candidatus Saccharibacteria bacterium]